MPAPYYHLKAQGIENKVRREKEYIKRTTLNTFRTDLNAQAQNPPHPPATLAAPLSVRLCTLENPRQSQPTHFLDCPMLLHLGWQPPCSLVSSRGLSGLKSRESA